MPSQPLVTIGIPVTNEAVSQAALAIRSVLCQTFQDFELIVVVNTRRNDVLSFLSRLRDDRIRMVHNSEQRNLSANLNLIAREARGVYLFRMDADDVSMPRRLESQLEALMGPDRPDVVTTQMAIIDTSDELRGVSKVFRVPSSINEVVKRSPLPHGTAAATTEWFRQHPYDESLNRSQDRALWMSAVRDSKLLALEDILYLYRVPTGLSLTKYRAGMKSNRQALLHHARPHFSLTVVARTYMMTHVKETIVRAAYMLGLEHRLYSSRIGESSSDVIEEVRASLAAVKATTLPMEDHD